MEKLIASCNAAADYPRNLVKSNIYEFVARSYYDKLDEIQDDLFHDEDKAVLDFWEFGNGKAFWPNRVCDLHQLREHLGVESLPVQTDPKCSFVNAPHSRERLYTTRILLALCLTYQQAIPAFLDFIFPFGRQEYERGFHFGGFRYQTRLSHGEKGLQVPELGWSGRDYKLCYNLKSVERAHGGGEPWSIRQAAIHHSFDVESGQTSWIIIKANKVLQTRIKSATGSRGLPKVCSFQGLSEAFASTLATHLLFCEWSQEGWRWYINFLEETFQETTRQTLSPIVRTPTSPAAGLDQLPPRQQLQSQKMVEFCDASEGKKSSHPSPPTQATLPGFQYLTNGMKEPPQSPYATDPFREGRSQGFSFTDLQRIQNIEDKANAAMLILKNNVSVFADLQKFYNNVAMFQSWSNELVSQKQADMLRFEQEISSIVNDMRLQLSRIGTLLQFIANRKSLLYGILESQNIEANKMSTENMQNMTANMHEIAVKTKQETISMRIITFVTLCFLPGTFISTLMSTDIIHFPRAKNGPFKSSFSLGALQLYLLISLPLVVFTLVGWYLFYLWEIRKKGQPSSQTRKCQWRRIWDSTIRRFRSSRSPELPS